MSSFLFVNNFSSTLAASVTNTATTLTVASTTNLPSSLSNGQQIPITLNDAATRTVFETCYVTGISGNTLTVLRAQEGTSAQNWNTGDYVFTGPTAGSVMPTPGTHYPAASETLPAVPGGLTVIPNAITADSTFTLPSTGLREGTEYTLYGSSSAYTATYETDVTSGSPYIELPDGSQVYSWTIPASSPSQGLKVVWDGTNFKATTFGQTVVADGIEPNQATNLGQLFIGNRKAVFTANGTWTVPSYVATIWVSGVAAGGGGGSGAYGVAGGAGGGAGQSTIKQAISVTGGHTLSVSIGAGGAGGAGGNNAGAAGGNTILVDSTSSTTLLTLNGGGGGPAGGAGSTTTNASTAASSGYPGGGCGSIINAWSIGGQGSSSPFGGGGSFTAGTETGQGGGIGAGGGGGCAGSNGGNGGNGFFVIEW